MEKAWMIMGFAASSQAVFRERAVAALSQRLHVSLSSTRPAAREQLEKLFETQQELQQRGVQLRMTVRHPAPAALNPKTRNNSRSCTSGASSCASRCRTLHLQLVTLKP